MSMSMSMSKSMLAFERFERSIVFCHSGLCHLKWICHSASIAEQRVLRCRCISVYTAIIPNSS